MEKRESISQVTNEDCMELMSRYPDKYFELAIVDPPYGIDIEQRIFKDDKKWDTEIPTKEYFDQLFRVSKNQIIWGGNYFIQHLYPTKCFLTWDKKITDTHTFSMVEFAWTSFNTCAKTFYSPPPGHRGFYKIDGVRIHPTQKPVDLYKWLLKNYASDGDKILDTHLGSGSSRIAADKMGFDFYACELDRDYFEAQEKRFKEYKSQLILF
jgi:site-specific DNA-methyltransferase (adenine-specific)